MGYTYWILLEWKKHTNNQYQSFRSSSRISTAVAPHPMNYRIGKIAVEYGVNVYEMEEETNNEQSNHIVARLIRSHRCFLRHYQRLHGVTVRYAVENHSIYHYYMCDPSLHTHYDTNRSNLKRMRRERKKPSMKKLNPSTPNKEKFKFHPNKPDHRWQDSRLRFCVPAGPVDLS